MDPERAILEPFELHFRDLLLLSAPGPAAASAVELERLAAISAAVMRALGPSGPGLLCITDVPRAPALRRALLPLARKLALLDNKDRARVLKEHGLGSDVSLKNPDRSVSSFSLQLKHAQGLAFDFTDGQVGTCKESCSAKENSNIHRLHGSHENEFEHLGNTFKELGLCMIQLGLQLAQICDKAIGGRELEKSILDSLTAKGRLIHYHSVMDNLIIKEANTRNKRYTRKEEPSILFSLPSQTSPEDFRTANRSTETRCNTTFSNLWQQWHYDYGIFTILTAPSFMSSCAAADDSCVLGVQECSSPDGHTYLQLFDRNHNKIVVVKSPLESFIIQVGEAADILSRGKLRSTLHSVGRPVELESLSRETFVVFLQPAWDKVLRCSGNLLDGETSQEVPTSSRGTSQFCTANDTNQSSIVVGTQEPHGLIQDVLREVPPLSSRLRDGMTFAEFSRETTKQYYGGNGTQSRK